MESEAGFFSWLNYINYERFLDVKGTELDPRPVDTSSLTSRITSGVYRQIPHTAEARLTPLKFSE